MSIRQAILISKRLLIQLKDDSIDYSDIQQDLILLEKSVQKLLLSSKESYPFQALTRLFLVPEKLLRSNMHSLPNLLKQVLEDLQALTINDEESSVKSSTVPTLTRLPTRSKEPVQSSIAAPAVVSYKKFHLPSAKLKKSISNETLALSTHIEVSQPKIQKDHSSKSVQVHNLVNDSVNEKLSNYLYLLERLRVDLTKGIRPDKTYIEFIKEYITSTRNLISSTKAKVAQTRTEMKKVWETKLRTILEEQEVLQKQWKSIQLMEQSLEKVSDLEHSVLQVLDFHQSHQVSLNSPFIETIPCDQSSDLALGRKRVLDQLQIVLDQRDQDGSEIEKLVERLAKIKPSPPQTAFEKELVEKYQSMNHDEVATHAKQVDDRLEEKFNDIYKS